MLYLHNVLNTESEKKMRFNEMELSAPLLRAIEDCGYTEATYIQKACIPVVLNGGDVIGQSQTGTGKTAAFGIPLVEMLDPTDKKQPRALILSPTRELALQVCDEIRKYAKYKDGIRTVCIYGGQPINRQILDLKKGADIVVGTPGRILDHIERRTLRFQNCQILVLDEADEMLNMGFREDIESVITNLPEHRQTILFSATMPQPILEITKQFQTNPVHIKNPEAQMTSRTIEQIYYECNQSDKRVVLMQLVQMMNPGLAMVFCNTKKMVDDLVGELVSKGYPAAGIHGDMKQEMRSLVMEKFKSRKITMLVATDVAARGIDVDSMDVVFNFDFPQETEYYVHRIGRTGRAGKAGLAVTLLTPRQRNKIRDLERLTKSKVERKELPTRKEMKQFQLSQIKAQLLDDLNHDIPSEIQQVLADVVTEGYSYEQIAQSLAFKVIGQDVFAEVKKPKESDSLRAKNKTMATLLLDVGKRQEVAAAHVVSAVAEASGISGKDIGKIIINDKDTTLEVPLEFAAQIIDSIQGSTIRGFVVHAVVLDAGKKMQKDKRKDRFPSKPKEAGSSKEHSNSGAGRRGKSRFQEERDNKSKDKFAKKPKRKD